MAPRPSNIRDFDEERLTAVPLWDQPRPAIRTMESGLSTARFGGSATMAGEERHALLAEHAAAAAEMVQGLLKAAGTTLSTEAKERIVRTSLQEASEQMHSKRGPDFRTLLYYFANRNVSRELAGSTAPRRMRLYRRAWKALRGLGTNVVSRMNPLHSDTSPEKNKPSLPLSWTIECLGQSSNNRTIRDD